MAQLRVPATLMTPRDTSDRSIDFFVIPEEVREYDQWVCWRYQARDGQKGGKIPITVDAERRSSPASTTDPATWMTSQGAKWHGVMDPAADTAGIGFVFAADDPFVGIDLDGCVDDSGTIDEWAQEIIDRIDSYTEFSPSGTGIHIIAKGAVLSGGSRRGSVEMYDSNRYFTMTGHHVPGTPDSVEQRDEAIAAVHREHIAQDEEDQEQTSEQTSREDAAEVPDDELIERARRAKKGATFARLWTGDTSGYNSHSEADQALCCHLAFWTRHNAHQMDRLFRRSGLFREKWDRQHFADGRTYGEATIDTAMRLVTNDYTLTYNHDRE